MTDESGSPGDVTGIRRRCMLFMEEVEQSSAGLEAGIRRCSRVSHMEEDSEVIKKFDRTPQDPQPDRSPQKCSSPSIKACSPKILSTQTEETPVEVEEITKEEPVIEPAGNEPKPDRDPSPVVVESNTNEEVAKTNGDVPRENGISASKTDLPHKFVRTATTVSNALIAVKPNQDETGKRVGSRRGLNRSTTHSKLSSFRVQRDRIDQCLLYVILKPLFISMRIAGIFLVRGSSGSDLMLDDNDPAERKARTKTARCLRGAQLVYCVVVLVVLVLKFIRTFWVFTDEDTEGFGFMLFFKISWCLVWYESVSRSVFCLVVCLHKKAGLPSLFCQIERVCYPDRIVPYEDKLRKFMVYMMVASGLALLATTACTAYAYFGNDTLAELYHPLLFAILPDDLLEAFLPGAKVVMILMVTLGIAVSLLSTVLFAIVCYIMFEEFDYFQRTLSMKINPDGRFMDDLEKFRLKHHSHCKLVIKADAIFKYFVANAYLSELPPLGLMVYALLENGLSLEYKLYGMAFILWYLYHMVVISVAATRLNTMAHTPLMHIHSIRSHEVTGDRQLVINMFMNRLTGTSIGLTAWDMFVINKPTMLTIIGMILTYFFLLVQFRNPLQEGEIGDGFCRCLLYGDAWNGSMEEPMLLE